MKQPSQQQLIGVIGTLVFHVAILLVLLTLHLRYDPAAEAAREWPPVDSAEILFGGEYVALGQYPDIEPSADAAAESMPEPEPAFVEETAPEAPSQTTTIDSKVPSPAKVETPKKEDPAPKKPSIDPAAKQRAEEQTATAKATDSRVSNAFASSSSNSTKSSGGNPNGNASTGNTSGQPGASLGGRTLASWVKARGNAVGTITVDVTVNRQGRVVSASYNPSKSSGAVAGSTAARESCISAAKQCTFSVATDGPENQRGTISFKFK